MLGPAAAGQGGPHGQQGSECSTALVLRDPQTLSRPGSTQFARSNSSLSDKSPRHMVEAEELMQEFIRDHMTGILHPVTEHVRELKEHVRDLTQDLCAVSSRADHQESKLGEHTKALFALDQTLREKTMSLIDGLRGDLQTETEEREKVGQDLRTARENIKKLEGRMSTVCSAVDVLQHQSDDLDSLLRQLQGNLASTKASLTTRMDEGNGQLRSLLEGLNERQVDTAARLAQTREHGDATHDTLKALSKAVDQHRKDSAVEANRAAEHRRELEDLTRTTSVTVNRHAEAHRQASSDLQHLKSGFSRMSNYAELMREHSDNIATVRDHTLRLDSLTEGLGSARKEINEIEGQLAQRKREMETTKSSGMLDLMSIEEAQRACDERVSRILQRVSDVEERQRCMGEQANAAERFISETSEWRTRTAGDMDVQSTKIDKSHNDLQRLLMAMDTATKNVQGLRNELHITNDTVGRLGAGLEVCQKCVHGLSKGFKDAHRQVSTGEAGMLSPKASLGSSELPSLPQMSTFKRAESPLKTSRSKNREALEGWRVP